MRTAEQIVALFHDRQKARGEILTRMEAIRDQVNGDVVIPMPQFQDREQQSYVANLAQQGLDNYGRRIASVDPDVDCPAVDERNTASRKRADTRRKALLGMWALDGFNVLHADWALAAGVAGGAYVLSALTSIVTSGVGQPGDPSAVKTTAN